MDPEVIDDRRAAIEAAFAEAEEVSNEVASQASTTAPVADQGGETAEGNDEGQNEGSETEGGLDNTGGEDGVKDNTATLKDGEQEPAQVAADRPPASWRAPQKAKWASIDPEVKQEIVRREKDVTRVLSETAQARQTVAQLNQVIQPFQARLQALNAHPLAAVQELLKADYVLATGQKNQKAQLIAKLIKDYDVDVQELDGVLAGIQSSLDPVTNTVEQMLQQRLAPFNQYLQQVRQQEQLREQAQNQQIAETVQSMENNPKFPYFDAVREDMGDIIDLAAKKGLYLSLEQAYSRAIAMNPEVSAQMAAKQQEEARKAAAKASNAKAQRALKASKSVGGAPTPVAAGASSANDRRATIAAAFDAVGGSR